MKLISCPTPQHVAALCADRVAACLQEKEAPAVLVPAGNTPVLLFQELVSRHRRGELDLTRGHWVQLDELVGVGPGDERSFQYFLRQHLSTPAGLPESCLHFLDGLAPDSELEIGRHANVLESLGGGQQALLGIGANGHVAFNEPGSPRTARARKVELASATLSGLRTKFQETELPRTGITLGILELYACESVLLLATGDSKAKVIQRLVTGPSDSSFPASFFTEHEAFTVFVDEQAGAHVPDATVEF